MAEQSTTPRKRSWVKYDKYFWDFLDRNHLTATERFTLVAIVSETQWQDQTWTGSLTDLSARTKINRGTLKSTVNRFVELGILECVRGFKSNSVGVFKLTCYTEMVVPERPRTGRPVGSTDSYQRTRTTSERRENAPDVTSIRSTRVNEQQGISQTDVAKVLMNTDIGYKSPREAERSEVESGEHPTRNEYSDENLWPSPKRNANGSYSANEYDVTGTAPLCVVCDQPCDDGHPFSHDAVLPDL